MLLIPCPWCGPRPEGEFVCAGEVLPPRPADPNAVSDAEWVDYVVMRHNVRGAHDERWWHVRGCGSWLTLRRDTVTHRIEPGNDAWE
jgi:heterotetrameric sarcosine oxidase delta subunit